MKQIKKTNLNKMTSQLIYQNMINKIYRKLKIILFKIVTKNNFKKQIIHLIKKILFN